MQSRPNDKVAVFMMLLLSELFRVPYIRSYPLDILHLEMFIKWMFSLWLEIKNDVRWSLHMGELASKI